MAASGPDINGRHRFNWEQPAIEFHLPLAFEDEVNLGHVLVIMGAGIFLDIDQVHAGDIATRAGESSSRRSAWAGHWTDFVQLRNHEVHSGRYQKPDRGC